MRLLAFLRRKLFLFRQLFLQPKQSDREQPADLDAAASSLQVPLHLAVIMDGNGRWAQKRGLPRQAGHRAGATKLQELCRLAIDYGIQYLTVYAFSTENWNRPKSEVHTLMELFIEFFHRFDDELKKEGIRVRFSGDLQELPPRIREIIERAERISQDRSRLQLCIAINYGGRRELVHACRRLAIKVQDGQLDAQAIDEKLLREHLYLPDIPDPDLIIRPSGEQRLSNFLLWQSAYAELWFSDCLWPDFSRAELLKALRDYTLRDRRYGGIKSS